MTQITEAASGTTEQSRRDAGMRDVRTGEAIQAGLAQAFAQMLSPGSAGGVGSTTEAQRSASDAVVDRSAASYDDADPRAAMSDPLGFEARQALNGEAARAIEAGDLEPGVYERVVGDALRGAGRQGGEPVGAAAETRARAAGAPADGTQGDRGGRGAGGFATDGHGGEGARDRGADLVTPGAETANAVAAPVRGEVNVQAAAEVKVPAVTERAPAAQVRVVPAASTSSPSPAAASQPGSNGFGTGDQASKRPQSVMKLEAKPAETARGREALADNEIAIERVQRGLAKLVQRDGGSMTLRLDPAALGSVRIDATIADGVVSASLITQNESAQLLLSRGIERLRAAMERRGLRVERLEVGGSADRALPGEVRAKNTPAVMRGAHEPGTAGGSGDREAPVSGVERSAKGHEPVAGGGGDGEEPRSGEESLGSRDGSPDARETRGGRTDRGGAPDGWADDDADGAAADGPDGRSPMVTTDAAGVLRLDATA